MISTIQLLREGRKDEIWTKHCGFIDLSINEFMEIQTRLLKEQIQLLKNSVIGKEIMGFPFPETIDEFRQSFPFTRYEDYARYLDVKNEDILPLKPLSWARTSGRSSAQGFKWVPYTKPMYDNLGDISIAAMILSSCTRKGDVRLELNDTILLATAPPPYVSGLLSASIKEQLDVRYLPSLELGEKMPYGERIALGFKLGMKEGLDYFYGVASVMVRIGEQFTQSSGGTKPSFSMLNPIVLWRLVRAAIDTRLKNRKLLPKDIWKLKGILAGGTDTDIYKQKIETYWGHLPLEGYACTEGGTMAIQAWNYKSLIFAPHTNFLEFIPIEEQHRNEQDPGYRPKTVLFSELQPGIYELVFTNFHGGVFSRYRVGDLFEVTALKDDEIGCKLPQLRYYSRMNDLIDLSGLLRLTEKDIWINLESSGCPYLDWIVCKEFIDKEPILHLYIELRPSTSMTVESIKEMLARQFRNNHSEFRDFEGITGRNPLQVTLLPPGTFEFYMEAQQKAGADLAHLKPQHIQPSEDILSLLLQNVR